MIKHNEFACKVCGQFHEPHCMSAPINPPMSHGFISLPIDWEMERISMARAAMQGFCANPAFEDASHRQIAERSVAYADALIAELRKGVQP